jgi:hypothetical protein
VLVSLGLKGDLYMIPEVVRGDFLHDMLEPHRVTLAKSVPSLQWDVKIVLMRETLEALYYQN